MRAQGVPELQSARSVGRSQKPSMAGGGQPSWGELRVRLACKGWEGTPHGVLDATQMTLVSLSKMEAIEGLGRGLTCWDMF